MSGHREGRSGAGASRATVFIVDPDQHIRSSMTVLLEQSGVSPMTFASAEEFLAAADPSPPACVVTEVSLPGISGLELQQKIIDLSPAIPVIFVVSQSDIPTAVRALRRGAVDFLEKPFIGQVLLRRIDRALAISSERTSRAPEPC